MIRNGGYDIPIDMLVRGTSAPQSHKLQAG